MAMSTCRGSVPAFIGIDVEPEGFQVDTDASRRWDGFASALEMVASLRERLALRSESVPQFGWCFRTDPQIREAFGRADVAMAGFADAIGRLRAHGDYFGVHMHPIRWSAVRNQWIHDIEDRRWLRECAHASLDAFEEWNGSPARVFRSGAGFLHDDILDVLEERCVAIELSLEPVSGWGLGANVVPSGIDESPIEGSYIDCADTPAIPYYPARGDFRRPGGMDARKLLLVPLSSGPYSIPRSGWLSSAKRAVRRFTHPPRRHMYFPSSRWPSPRHFWDVVDHALGTMRHPYLSLAIRTDRRGSPPDLCARAIFQELATHPIAERLRFVDPVSARDALMSGAPTVAVGGIGASDALAADMRNASARETRLG